MQIIPAIDIKDGRVVRLTQGDYNREIVYDTDPISVAQKWKKMGANMLHIVDLDGAKSGEPINIEKIKELVKKINIPIQVGGGARTLKSIKNLIGAGIFRVILGTVVLENRSLLNKAIRIYDEKIIVSLDVKNSKLMKKGWVESTDKKLTPMIQSLEKMGIREIIYSDTIRDGTLTEPNYKEIQSLMEKTKLKLIIAGGISSIEQIKKLEQIKVKGVIIGKALYEGKINLMEAIKYVS